MKSKTKQANFWLVAIAFLLCCFMSTLNLFFFAVMFFAIPAFTAYIYCTTDVKSFIYICVSAVTFSVITTFSAGKSPTWNAVWIFLLLIPGLISGICFKAKKDFTTTFISHIAYDFLALLILFAVLRFGCKIDITAIIRDVLCGTFTEQITIIESVYPQLSDFIAESEHQVFEAMYIGLPGYIPFFASLIFSFIFLFRYALGKLFCVRFFISNGIFSGGFDTFRVGAVSNCFLFIMLLLSYMSETPLFTMICLNALFITMTLYFLGGLSLLEHKLKQNLHYPGRRFLAIIGIFVVLIIVSVVIPVFNFIYVFLFLGFADSLFDFRKLNAKKGDS